jgi:hypothetical protein
MALAIDTAMIGIGCNKLAGEATMDLGLVIGTEPRAVPNHLDAIHTHVRQVKGSAPSLLNPGLIQIPGSHPFRNRQDVTR